MIWVCVCERVDVPVCACGAGQQTCPASPCPSGTADAIQQHHQGHREERGYERGLLKEVLICMSRSVLGKIPVRSCAREI